MMSKWRLREGDKKDGKEGEGGGRRKMGRRWKKMRRLILHLLRILFAVSYSYI